MSSAPPATIRSGTQSSHDIAKTPAANGEVLKWSEALLSYVPSPDNATPGSLNDIPDVTAPAPASGDILSWNGVAWVNDDSYVRTN